MKGVRESAVPVVIYDTGTEEFKENRVFNHQYASKFPSIPMLAILGERARKLGWAVMTADVFLRAPSSKAVCISERVTPYTRALMDHGVVPAVILSGESPNVAWNFYYQLRKYSQPFRHAYLFRGALTRVPESVRKHAFYWPNSQREIISGRAWHDRDYLVAVASNKDRYAVAPGTPFLGLCRLAKRLVWGGLELVDPLFRFEDLYQLRLDAIRYFSEVPDFKLYGRGWEAPAGSFRYLRRARRAGGAPVDDKLKAMANFRFALCFENCVFPGYLTEKIFDGFFAGCIPVYRGAPDISEFVPAETFVDARQFKDWAELDDYLRGMPERESDRYREAACSFLASKEFDKFHQDTFVDELISIIEPEFANMG